MRFEEPDFTAGVMNNVCAILQERGLTQQWLAKQIAVDESVISRYKNGNRLMPGHVMAKIAYVLNVGLGEIKP